MGLASNLGMAKAKFPTAAPFLPSTDSLPRIAAAANGCRGCDLYQRATQTVFGEGPAGARWLFVGEQPGDEEDKKGHPFVGPAGRLLKKALEEVGFDLSEIYLTNAVKHFKWVPDERPTKRRIHGKPSAAEVNACKPWLERELQLVRPTVVVCLGATAVQAVLGSSARVMRDRGRPLPTKRAAVAFVTVHPSAILRASDSAARREAYLQFLEDLRAAHQWKEFPDP